MSEEDTHIKKKRTTALKIIVDEKTKRSTLEMRTFLGNLFDFPGYYEQEDRIVKRCKIKRGENEYNVVIGNEVQEVLQANNIDPTTFGGYFEETTKVFKIWGHDINDKIREATGMTNDTSIE